MKVVTLEMTKSLDPCYMGAKFPLYVLHSTEELNDFMKEIGKEPIIVKNSSELVKYIEGKKYPNYAEEIDKIYTVQDEYVWLATNEIYKPDKFVNGVILYQTQNGQPIRTDNCYVQLIAFKVTAVGVIAATSSGLYIIRFWGEWVTAAIKPDYARTASTGRGSSKYSGTEEAKQRKYNKLLKRKTLSPGDIRFIFYTVLPSMQFKSIYHAAHKAYGLTYPKKIIDKLLETERIQKGIIKELAKMIPNFEEVLLKVYSQEEIAQDIKEMVKKTLERNSNEYDVDATRKALSVVFKVLDQPTTISPLQQQPLIAGAIPKMITPTQAEQLAKENEVEITEEDVEKFEKSIGAPLTGSTSNKNNQQIIDIQ